MKIAILCGGNSFEHEISIVSAISLKKVLIDKLIFIFLDSNSRFYLVPNNKMKSNLFSSRKYKNLKELYIENGGFFEKTFFGKKRVDFSFIINLVHGKDGEDGVLSAIFEFYNIRYIGPRMEASIISYNKFLTKAYANSIGVKTFDYQVLNINNINKKIDIDFPLIVKPLRLGSSIGIAVAQTQQELEYALDSAFEFDDDVIIESFYENIKEYNLAGFKTDDFIFSIIEEPQKDKILDFDKKYLDFSRTKTVKKTDLSNKLQDRLKDTFKKIYGDIFSGSIIRCDFFIINNEIFLNEINPIPGSMANYLFEDFNTLIKDLSNFLPSSKSLNISYKYINQLQSSKGK